MIILMPYRSRSSGGFSAAIEKTNWKDQMALAVSYRGRIVGYAVDKR
jgi:hypothetical protein